MNMKFFGGVESDPVIKWLDFGGSLDNSLDPGIFLKMYIANCIRLGLFNSAGSSTSFGTDYNCKARVLLSHFHLPDGSTIWQRFAVSQCF